MFLVKPHDTHIYIKVRSNWVIAPCIIFLISRFGKTTKQHKQFGLRNNDEHFILAPFVKYY